MLDVRCLMFDVLVSRTSNFEQRTLNIEVENSSPTSGRWRDDKSFGGGRTIDLDRLATRRSDLDGGRLHAAGGGKIDRRLIRRASAGAQKLKLHPLRQRKRSAPCGLHRRKIRA